MEGAYEETRTVLPEAFVYRIPPKRTAEGHRAADWDLTSPIWTGKVKVTSKGPICSIRLEDSQGQAFAVCSWNQETEGPQAVEKVLDSSRYYALRIENQGRYAFIGLGFGERNDAFEFNVALQDHKSELERDKRIAEDAVRRKEEPKLDLALKEGQTINISIGGAGTGGRRRRQPRSNAGTSAGGGLLPPPPSAKTSVQRRGGHGAQGGGSGGGNGGGGFLGF